MNTKQALPWMVLQHLPELGHARQRKLLDQFGSPKAILRTAPSQWAVTVSPVLADAVSQWQTNPQKSAVQQRALRDIDYMQKAGIQLITWASADYPLLLANIFDPPPLLYVRGRPKTLGHLQLAVVGSRKTTSAGRRAARELAAEAVAAGLTVTSGLALGVDGEAHRAALSSGGKTLAVLGTGIDIDYPRRHKRLAEEIAEVGALVTEFPPGLKPHRGTFPRRNRIISGLSLGVLVVEAGQPSGSLITARLAMEQGREVFAVPGSIYNPASRGCHSLIRDGAKLVESFADIHEELNCLGLKQLLVAGDQRSDCGRLDHHQQQLMPLIGFEVVHVDALVLASGLPVPTVLATLTSLELSGRIECTAGGYIRI